MHTCAHAHTHTTSGYNDFSIFIKITPKSIQSLSEDIAPNAFPWKNYNDMSCSYN